MAKRTGKTQPEDTTPYDSQWKAAISELSCPFMQLFFPQIAAEIDWDKDWTPLDKELRPRKLRDAVGVREPDLIFGVHRLDGEAGWVTIHIEFQAHQENAAMLAQRVWVYFTRIRQRYGRKVCSLVLLGDIEPHTRWQPFEEELWGCKCTLTFPVARLLELEERLDQPELSTNPFSWIVRLHLAAKRSTGLPTKRQAYKRQYLIELHCAIEDGRLDRNDAETIRRILIFHDEILSLSAENDKLFEEESEQDEEIKMIKQEQKPAGMLNRWALEAEREKTKQAEEAAKQAEETARQERKRAEMAEQRGLEQGQYLRSIAIAKAMLRAGYDLDKVCELTGTTTEQLDSED